MSNSKRNSCIDTLKGFACIAVVLIHYNWSNDFGMAVKTVARFAVPFFFFVSGYYLPNRSLSITRESAKRKGLNILKMLLKHACVYLVFCIVWNYLMDRSWDIVAFTKAEVFPSMIVKLIITNDPFVYSHFWYMLALVYNYGVMYFLEDKLPEKAYPVVSLVLMAGFSLFAEFNGLLHLSNNVQILNSGTYLMLFNLFIFRALPFFMLGVYVRKRGGFGSAKLSRKLLFAVIAAGSLLALAETRIKEPVQFYVGTYFVVLAMIVLSVRYPDWSIKPMEYIGGKLSMYIYIYHIAVGKVFDLLAAKAHLWGSNLFKLTRPFLIIIASLGLSWLMVTLEEKRKLRAKT